ncbi:unnamed protein product [Notodromas monacha]|uniref:RING-type E3 ubiquitin transferase n=1 Tax=Notodromas monacha TaxID=399045 RepID=A0A7R9BJ23_9CRUS|nr:unnamed protein product [Notodromas monacha]CAG0915552.1 unnamed protein product [Notodromas monacha]
MLSSYPLPTTKQVTFSPIFPRLSDTLFPMTGRHAIVSPPDGCDELEPAPIEDVGFNPGKNWIAVIRKGGCDFKTKVLNAKNANYSAAIIYNVGSNRLELMRCQGVGCSDLIPSMFIGADDGMLLQRYESTEFLVYLTDELPFDLNKYLLPFAIVVGVCFFILLVFMVYKCVRDSRRARRHRMPSRSLKKIPLVKFKKGDPYDICAICLDEYIDGEKLRVLNCSHAFHSKCVDPWLTKNRRVCPICKRKVFASDERHRPADSSSDEDDDGSSRRSTSQPLLVPPRSSEEESAPLLAQGPVSNEQPARVNRFLSFFRRAPMTSQGSSYGTVGAQGAPQVATSEHSINAGDDRSIVV